MSKVSAQGVGLVSAQRARFDQPLELRSGAVLPGFDLVYETYGTLNADASNAILVCHALSGHHHVAGYTDADNVERTLGWWDNIVGPGRPLDTGRFFIVGLNTRGGCPGSPGPESLNPAPGQPGGAGHLAGVVVELAHRLLAVRGVELAQRNIHRHRLERTHRLGLAGLLVGHLHRVGLNRRCLGTAHLHHLVGGSLGIVNLRAACPLVADQAAHHRAGQAGGLGVVLSALIALPQSSPPRPTPISTSSESRSPSASRRNGSPPSRSSCAATRRHPLGDRNQSGREEHPEHEHHPDTDRDQRHLTACCVLANRRRGVAGSA